MLVVTRVKEKNGKTNVTDNAEPYESKLARGNSQEVLLADFCYYSILIPAFTVYGEKIGVCEYHLEMEVVLMNNNK